jgi:hypothetical protein
MNCFFIVQAQAKLGQLRVDANRIKSGLERKIQAHRAAVKRAKTILKQMQVMVYIYILYTNY